MILLAVISVYKTFKLRQEWHKASTFSEVGGENLVQDPSLFGGHLIQASCIERDRKKEKRGGKQTNAYMQHMNMSGRETQTQSDLSC